MIEMKKDLIAPCGMNCRLCIGYQRQKNKCPGCRNLEEIINSKTKGCGKCIIKNCPEIEDGLLGYCFECEKMPCKRLKQLDIRYKTKYHMSMIENQEYMKKHGIDAFIANEEKRWKCSNCGSVLCVHREVCLNCNVTLKF